MNDRVYENAMVVALLKCDVKHGIAMGAKLRETGEYLNVKEFDAGDVCTVRSFEGAGTPASHLEKRSGGAVFGIMNINSDPTVLYPIPNRDGTVRLLRRELDIFLRSYANHVGAALARASSCPFCDSRHR